MMFLIRDVAGRGHEGATPAAIGDERGLCRMLHQDWRRLYPLRHTLGPRIRQVLAHCPEAGPDARAAFGVDDGAGAADWLYRDFYVHVPPPRPSVDRAIGRLRRGDPTEMREVLAEAPDGGLRRMWYEVSTLAGRLAGTLCMEPDGGAAGAPEPGPEPGKDDAMMLGLGPAGRGARIANRAAVVAQVQEILEGPLDIEAHRQRMLRSLYMLLGGDMPGSEAADCMRLLIHHTDLSLRHPLRLDRLGSHQAAGLYRALIALQGWLRDPVRFVRLLREGLSSPSRQRRFLSYRLLRIEGRVGDRVHPDDATAQA